MALILREMSTTYGRSPGGYLWAVLEPVAGIMILTAIFSAGFRSPPIGTNFPMFYATGMVPFVAYMNVSAKVSQSINYSRQLLAYPSITYVDALLARFALNALTAVLVGYFIFAGIFLFTETNHTLRLDRVALSYAMAGSLALGIGTMNSVLMAMFPIWQQVWSILNRPLFILSGIFFLFDTIPQPYQDYLWYNPLIHVVGSMRSAFYGSYEANYISPLYVFSISLTLLVLGLIFLRRFHRDIINS
ncbi:MAG: ABC transporter permease [Alterinioella nitratireducens]|uniref:ABC transporter permease n=1 Tax=Alterinioella nitratireducens TaxID=2735915 RepID=UPI004057F0C7